MREAAVIILPSTYSIRDAVTWKTKALLLWEMAKRSL